MAATFSIYQYVAGGANIHLGQTTEPWSGASTWNSLSAPIDNVALDPATYSLTGPDWLNVG